MAQLLLLCFILVHVSSSLATASGGFKPHPMVRASPEPKGLSGSDPPATHGPMSREMYISLLLFIEAYKYVMSLVFLV